MNEKMVCRLDSVNDFISKFNKIIKMYKNTNKKRTFFYRTFFVEKGKNIDFTKATVL